jgi:hypothetical protein
MLTLTEITSDQSFTGRHYSKVSNLRGMLNQPRSSLRELIAHHEAIKQREDIIFYVCDHCDQSLLAARLTFISHVSNPPRSDRTPRTISYETGYVFGKGLILISVEIKCVVNHGCVGYDNLSHACTSITLLDYLVVSPLILLATHITT